MPVYASGARSTTASGSRVQQVCEHRRLIEDVRTKEGQRTGRVRCVECGMIMPDPHDAQDQPNP